MHSWMKTGGEAYRGGSKDSDGSSRSGNMMAAIMGRCMVMEREDKILIPQHLLGRMLSS